MAILKIARMGHEVLLASAAPVEAATAPDIRRLLADMAETLDDAGGVGLAAPQVHVSLRLFIYFVPASRAGIGPPVALTAIINPQITPLSDEITQDWEGCLSIPGLRAAVPRHTHIRLTAQDHDGTPFTRDLTGFEARIVQHENDHLDGILYPSRMTDHSRFGFNEELARNHIFFPPAEPAT
jgi:peptide deformylase